MSKEFRHIIRIADTDLDGTLKVGYALAKIRGVGISLANAIMKKAGIDPDTRLGLLSEADVERLKDIINNPMRHGVPGWLLNRPKDKETGKALHLTASDLALQIKTDIDQMKKIRSWRGFRHAYGLRVRGQRTRTTGRIRKAMSVKKKPAERVA
ncbi:MAG: 30S ribosomal protein S13 [Candidatus Bathyarchaeota archaeon BA1]|nr:MAG: 30S ribosomal protein S13 [Candidatus Bathyarchaeota archaeon BA1]